jgi:hypothetical protein
MANAWGNAALLRMLQRSVISTTQAIAGGKTKRRNVCLWPLEVHC